MGNATDKWVHSTGRQSITTPSIAKTETLLGGYSSTEFSHHNNYTNGVKDKQMTALGVQESPEH
jgi:hypothetical protein